MATIFIIHGAYGSPEENWFPWLKKELEAEGHTVFTPTFPTPEGQNLESWTAIISQYKQDIDKNTIFIGHSVAVAFILQLLETTPVKAAVFVSGWTGPLGNPTFDTINKTITNRTFDFKAIQKNCSTFLIYHSDNDPYVSLELGKELAEKLEVKLTLISGAGHFNKDSDYTTFERLLTDLKEIL